MKDACHNSHQAGHKPGRKLAAAGYRKPQTEIKVRLKRLGISRRQARLDEGLMTATQLASVAGVGAKTVLRWIDREDLPAVHAAVDKECARDSEISTSRRLRGWLGGHAGGTRGKNRQVLVHRRCLRCAGVAPPVSALQTILPE